MKKILVITYSQSGQLDDIVDQILRPLKGHYQVTRVKLKPVPDFPFPWKDISFWDAMPESVRMIPSELEPIEIDFNEKFDLIILGYPIWFLSPPIPLTSFLKSETAKRLMAGKPVVTVLGTRNMWVGAQEDIKKMIHENGGLLKGNISLRDRHHNLPSVITIIYWMITGKKDRYLGIFPKPGISDEDISGAEKFGKPIREALESNNLNNLHEQLLKIKAVELIPSIVMIEETGKKIFQFWSKFILKKGGSGTPERVGRLKLFKWYLLFVIFAVSPIVTVLFHITQPLFFRRRKKKINYYKGINLK